MRRTICAICLLVCAGGLFAQGVPSGKSNEADGGPKPPLPRYRVVKSWPVKQAVPALNEAASQGYRVLLLGKLAIMRLDTEPPEIYRYMAIPNAGIFATLMNAVNQQGAFGYRWMANTDLMEKEPHPHNYEYETIEGFKADTREQSRRSLVERGFVSVGAFATRPIFMHELDSAPPAHPERQSKFVDMASEKKTFKDITKWAQQGYRYIGPDYPANGHGLRMEICDESCGGPFEYRRVEVKDVEQLQDDLNDAAQKGFHLVRRSFHWPPELLERGANHTPGFEYRVGSADDATATEQFVNAGDRDGFVPVAFAAHVGWTVHAIVILEKPVQGK